MSQPPPVNGGWPGPQFPPTGHGTAQRPVPVKRPYSLAASFEFGWRTTVAHLAVLALVMLPLLALGAVRSAARFVVIPAGPKALVPAFGEGLASATGLAVVLAIVTGLVWVVLVQSILARAALARLEGEPLGLATLVGVDRLVAVLQYGLVVTLPTTIGALLTAGSVLGAPALVGFLGLPIQIALMFTSVFGVFFVLKGVPPVSAIAMSYRLVSKHWGDVLALTAVSAAVVLAGLFLFGIGLVVAIPVIVFAQGYAFKTLRRRGIVI